MFFWNHFNTMQYTQRSKQNKTKHQAPNHQSAKVEKFHPTYDLPHPGEIPETGQHLLHVSPGRPPWHIKVPWKVRISQGPHRAFLVAGEWCRWWVQKSGETTLGCLKLYIIVEGVTMGQITVCSLSMYLYLSLFLSTYMYGLPSASSAWSTYGKAQFTSIHQFTDSWIGIPDDV